MGDLREVPGTLAIKTNFGEKKILSPVYTLAVVLDYGVLRVPFTQLEIRAFVDKHELRAALNADRA